MKLSKILMPLILTSTLMGCSSSLGRLSLVSTGATPISENTKKGAYYNGSSCIRRILFFHFGDEINRLSNAVADALEEAANDNQPADALINVEMRESYFNILIYGSNCIDVKGQAIGLGKIVD